MSGKIQGNLLRREIHAPHVLADNRKELIYPAYPLTSGITANLLVRAVKQALELMKAQPFEWMPEQMRLFFEGLGEVEPKDQEYIEKKSGVDGDGTAAAAI